MLTDSTTAHTEMTKRGCNNSLIITEFSEVTEKKDNIEKSTVLPYTSNKQLNTDIQKNHTIYNSIKIKIKYLDISRGLICVTGALKNRRAREVTEVSNNSRNLSKQ